MGVRPVQWIAGKIGGSSWEGVKNKTEVDDVKTSHEAAWNEVEVEDMRMPQKAAWTRL
jgi:hypothetical protein